MQPGYDRGNLQLGSFSSHPFQKYPFLTAFRNPPLQKTSIEAKNGQDLDVFVLFYVDPAIISPLSSLNTGPTTPLASLAPRAYCSLSVEAPLAVVIILALP